MKRPGTCPVLTAFIVASVVSLAPTVYTDNYACFGPDDDPWKIMIKTATDVQEYLCFKVMGARRFKDALADCHRQQASVLSLGFTNVEYILPDSSLFIDLLASKGVTKLWHGLYITDSLLRMDKFPTPQHKFEETFLNGFTGWDDVEKLGETSECFEQVVNRPPNCTLSVDLLTSPIGFRRLHAPFYSLVPPSNENGAPDSAISWIEQPFARTKRKRSAYMYNAYTATEVENENLRLSRTNDVKIRTGRTSSPVDPSRLKTNKKVKVRVKRAPNSDGDGSPPGSDCGIREAESIRARRCQDNLPFVCVKPALRRDDIRFHNVYPLCEDHEYGSLKLFQCLSFVPDTANYNTAQTLCKPVNRSQLRPRTLYRPLSQNPSPSSFSGHFVVTAIQNILSRMGELLTDRRFVWVGRQDEDAENCPALDVEIADIVSHNCSDRLPLSVCQGSMSLPDVAKLSMDIKTYSDINFWNKQIKSSNDREIIIPEESSRISSDFPPILRCVYDARLIAGLQNLVIVTRQIPMNYYSTVPSQIEVTIQNTIYNITNYYWCEVNDLKTGRIHRTRKFFLRPQGVQILAGSVAAGIQDRNQNQSMYYTTSLLGHPKALPQLPHEKTFHCRAVRYRPDLKTKGRLMTVDFLVFNTTVTNWPLEAAKQTVREYFLSISTSALEFFLTSIEVRSIDFCQSITIEDTVSGKTYDIPETDLGDVYTSLDICLANGEPYVRLKCEGDKMYGARWAEFKPNTGCNFDNVNTSESTSTLKSISKSDIDKETVEEAVTDTADIVSDNVNLAPVDVVYLADILQQASTIDNVSIETAQKILELVDTVSNINDTILEESNALGNATNRILKATDVLGDHIKVEDEVSKMVTPTIALEVWNLSKVTGDVVTGLELQMDGRAPVPVLDMHDLVTVFESDNVSYTYTDAAVLLPEPFVHEIQDGNPEKDIRLIMNIFALTSLFQVNQLEFNRHGNETRRKMTLNSKVVSARITVDGVPVSSLNNSVVTTVYLPLVRVSQETRTDQVACVFWNFKAAEGKGAWSEEGCQYKGSMEGRDVCVCDHLTNFAVLLDIYGQSELPAEHQFALSIISTIGLSLSIAGLALTVLCFLVIKKLRQQTPQQILFNMALAMLASWVIFLAGFNRVDNHIVCLTVAALLHYFILASFMWMLMEAVLQYLLFVKVLGNTFHNFMLGTAIPAWGIPLIPVIVVLVLDMEMYRGGNQYCWMAVTPFYYAFLAPVALIVFVNIVVYVMVVVSICRRQKFHHTRGSNVSGSSGHKDMSVRVSVACFIVLGLSWVLAFFAVEDARVVFQYLFSITTSLQGFLIFLVFTARNPVVRAYWKETCLRCCSRKQKSYDAKTTETRIKDTRSKELPLCESD